MSVQLFAVIPDARYIVLQLKVPNMDVEACNQMQALLKEQLDTHSGRPVILDLTCAKFLPSLAIGALVNLKKDLSECASELTIAGLMPNIRKALELSRLDRVFRLVDHLEQAVAPTTVAT